MFTDIFDVDEQGAPKRQDKGRNKKLFSEEIADVFAYLLVFAESEGVDLAESVEKKWFKYLD